MSMLFETAILRPHPGVAGDFRPGGKALMLALAGGDDSFTYLRGGFAAAFAGHFPEFHRWHLNVEVNPVQQGP